MKKADLNLKIKELSLLTKKKQEMIADIQEEIASLDTEIETLRASLEMKLEFETGTENHFDIGTVWVGYLIDMQTESRSPGKCVECEKWFTEETNTHFVQEQYVYHEVDGHDIAYHSLGYICQECFEKANQERKFRNGKLRTR